MLPVCTECEQGGELVQCVGGCRRFFHLGCIHQPVLNPRKWICSDCEKHVHRCCQCHRYAPDNSLLLCSFPDCSNYLHVECVPTSETCVYEPSFVCPAHFCSFCKRLGDSTHPLLHCTRCVKSYHTECLPSYVAPINAELFVCMRHRFEPVRLPPLTMQVLRERRAQEEESANKYIDTDISAICDYDRFCEDYYKSQSLAQWSVC
ncbi:hypothetical protein WA577_005180 [Blastocystis sp. JDR]